MHNPDGSEAANTGIEFRLPLREIDAGIVLPQVIKAQTDENGDVVVRLWPNENGVQSSHYDVTIFTSSRIVHDTIVVPDADCNLHDILQRRPYPSIDSAEQAVIDAQKAAADAQYWASQAQGGDGVLLPASATQLGGVMVGENLDVQTDGTLSIDTDGFDPESLINATWSV